MPRSTAQLREDALRIWQAGLEAVRSDRLVWDNVRVDGSTLTIGDEVIDLADVGRIAVVGAGKAGAGMAAGLEQALGPAVLSAKRVAGWVNVPADCVRELSAIHLHAARPAGVNEPTAEGVRGSEEILRLVGGLRPDDLCLCLLSGGASALLPAPVEGITLTDKQAVTRHLSAAGANIAELNAVRRELSRIKGGGLLRHRRAGRLIALFISDVLGDPLDVIGSGPTVESATTAADALEVLARYDARGAGISDAVFACLEAKRGGESGSSPLPERVEVDAGWRTADTAVAPSRDSVAPGEEAVVPVRTCRATNLIIGNNAVAVDAAGIEAERLGYSAVLSAAMQLEGTAEDVGRHLARMALRMRGGGGPDCLISGGEPVVRLAPADVRGRGGRNQQLVLAALIELARNGAGGVALVSGGTDGEDGPTDAAGAVLDEDLLAAARRRGLDAADFLRRNDAYTFFDALGGLMRTGPTHTNVCDVRVVVVDRA